MKSDPDRAVIVGVDGSDASLAALDLAAAEAASRKVPLQVIHGFVWPIIYPPLGAPADLTDPGPRPKALQLLAIAAERARARDASLKVTTRLVDGSPAGVLVNASKGAGLLVVGHRGHGGFTGLLAGSVSTQVAAHAGCPVLVTRPAGQADPRPPDAPVVVGVDGSALSAAAVEFAFEEAALRGAAVIAVHVRPAGAAPTAAGGSADRSAGGSAEPAGERVLAEALAGCEERYPGVPTSRDVRYGTSPAPALLEAAGGAGLVVVGSRGRGGFRGLLLGSVSQALLHHAPCPVAVVRPAAGTA